MKNSDMPVTPIFSSNGRIQPFTDDNGFSSMATGLTKREAFAMAAMQGILAAGIDEMNVDIALAATLQADKLLEELSK